MQTPNLSELQQPIPLYTSVFFILTTILAYFYFQKIIKDASGKYFTLIVFGIAIWLILQSSLAQKGFYQDTFAKPPRFLLAIGIPFLVIIGLFVTQKGKKLIDSLSLKMLTYLHIVRIPVEIVLFLLFLDKQIPQLMTFEGRNFDILAGISAPIMAYLVFEKQLLSKKILLIWNFIGLALLLNIVVNAILSAPTPLQQFAFEQPNVAILKFPIVWLPSFIVPVVLLSHLVAIRRLLAD